MICGSPLFNRARVALLGTVRQSSLLAVLFGGCWVIILLAASRGRESHLRTLRRPTRDGRETTLSASTRWPLMAKQ